MLTSEHFERGFADKGEPMEFVSLGQGYLTQCNIF